MDTGYGSGDAKVTSSAEQPGLTQLNKPHENGNMLHVLLFSVFCFLWLCIYGIKADWDQKASG